MSRVDLKIVLLGSEYVGKTSLLERYVHDRFSGNFSYQNTIGAAFAAKQVQAHNKKFVIGIWDTAGSERYESMSRIYYRGAKAAIVCYDIGNLTSWDRAKFWVSELRSLEENCRIYLCGTKKDMPEGRQVEINIASRYADGIQATYYETSSKTGENVVELFQTIAEDFISSPDNVRQVEDTITLSAKEKKSSCCSGRNGTV